MIKFVTDLWQVGGFYRVFRFPQPIKLTAMTCWNIIESGVKHHSPNHNPLDWLIVYYLTYSGKYVMHIQDEKRSTKYSKIYRIGQLGTTSDCNMKIMENFVERTNLAFLSSNYYAPTHLRTGLTQGACRSQGVTTTMIYCQVFHLMTWKHHLPIMWPFWKLNVR